MAFNRFTNSREVIATATFECYTITLSLVLNVSVSVFTKERFPNLQRNSTSIHLSSLPIAAHSTTTEALCTTAEGHSGDKCDKNEDQAQTCFSRNNLDTLEPIQPVPAGVRIGQRDGPSATDYQELNLLYQCSITNGEAIHMTPDKLSFAVPGPSTCQDRRSDCSSLVAANYCQIQASWMQDNCCASCRNAGTNPSRTL